MLQKAAVAVVLAMVVTACGTSRGERALTGGLAGAGVGAVGGAIFGDPLAGAVIGGAGGAAVGGLTDCEDVGSCDNPLD